MGNSAENDAAHGEENHGFGDVDALLVVAYEASPAGHPSKASLDHPAPRQNLEAGLGVGAADHLDDKVEEGGLVHQPEPVVGTVGEQVLDPGPALANAVEGTVKLLER